MKSSPSKVSFPTSATIKNLASLAQIQKLLAHKYKCIKLEQLGNFQLSMYSYIGYSTHGMNAWTVFETAPKSLHMEQFQYSLLE